MFSFLAISPLLPGLPSYITVMGSLSLRSITSFCLRISLWGSGPERITVLWGNLTGFSSLGCSGSINLERIPIYLTLSGSFRPWDNLPERFRLPGKSGIKQREYFLMICRCKYTPNGSMNFRYFGKGMRGIWVTYTVMTFLFHSPNRLSLIMISTAYSAMILPNLWCSTIMWYRSAGILNNRERYWGKNLE